MARAALGRLRRGRSMRRAAAAAALALLVVCAATAAGVPATSFRRLAVEPTDPQLSADQRWPLALLGLPAAWDVTTGAVPGPLVAVVDSGVTPTADLAGRVLPGASFAGGSATEDELGHGTMVAGIVAGAGNDGQGVVGVCWTCRIVPLRVADGQSGGVRSEDVAAAIDEAVRRGARIINLSLGATLHLVEEREAVARAVARGVLVVAAAGNDGSSEPSFPAAYAGVLSVGAAGADGTLADFSNRGHWVRVAAPACGAALAPGGAAIWFCGTSGSAPFVAGLAGLMLSVRPEAKAADLIAAIQRRARPLEGTAHGLVDAPATLADIRGAVLGNGSALGTPLLRVVRRPLVTGIAERGGRLRASLGSWSGPVASLAVRWERCSGRACLVAARGRLSYRVTRVDVGRTLRVVVRARGEDGRAVEARSALVRVRAR